MWPEETVKAKVEVGNETLTFVRRLVEGRLKQERDMSGWKTLLLSRAWQITWLKWAFSDSRFVSFKTDVCAHGHNFTGYSMNKPTRIFMATF